MPLDTSSYALALLRLDGRRWNELRRLTAQISTQAAADGSSYLEMGNTKVICTVNGPAEGRRAGPSGGSSGEAVVVVEIGIAGFSGVERKRRARGDKSVPPFTLDISSLFFLSSGICPALRIFMVPSIFTSLSLYSFITDI